MMPVCMRTRYHDLAVARELDFVRGRRSVRKSDSSRFGSIWLRDTNLHPCLDVTIATLENCTIPIERYAIRLWLDAQRLIRCRPDFSGSEVIYVDPLAVRIERRIAAPAIDDDVAVSRFATTSARNDRRKRRLTEYRNPRLSGMWSVYLTL
jgi:hypothetical protein